MSREIEITVPLGEISVPLNCPRDVFVSIGIDEFIEKYFMPAYLTGLKDLIESVTFTL